jgi:hypothetical protein
MEEERDDLLLLELWECGFILPEDLLVMPFATDGTGD